MYIYTTDRKWNSIKTKHPRLGKILKEPVKLFLQNYFRVTQVQVEHTFYPSVGSNNTVSFFIVRESLNLLQCLQFGLILVNRIIHHFTIWVLMIFMILILEILCFSTCPHPPGGCPCQDIFYWKVSSSTWGVASVLICIKQESLFIQHSCIQGQIFKKLRMSVSGIIILGQT